MELALLLADLAAAGIHLRLDGGEIVVSPASRLTTELSEGIRRFREELREMLLFHHGDGEPLLAMFRNPPNAFPFAASSAGRQRGPFSKGDAAR